MKTILVVDDDYDIVELIEQFLTIKGYKCISANKALDALEILRSGEKIDLIITDLIMHNLPGIDVIEEARSRKIPSLMMSGDSRIAAHIYYIKKIGIEFDVKDFVEKPIDLDQLFKKIKQKLPGPEGEDE